MNKQQIIVRNLSTANQVRFAIAGGLTGEIADQKFPDLKYVKQLAEGGREATAEVIERALKDGQEHAATVKALTSATRAGDFAVLEAYSKTGVIKAAVAPASVVGNSAIVYPGQQPGVTPLAPQVTRSLIAMLKDYGAPTLPPMKRCLTQPANLSAVEMEEGARFQARPRVRRSC